MDDDMIAAMLPVPGDSVTCGLRLDLPRKQRRHHYVSLGMDVKSKGAEGIVETEVRACVACGKDDR